MRVDQYLKRIADGLGTHVWDCKREYERYCRNQRHPARVEPITAAGGQAVSRAKPGKDDMDFIAALITFPELRALVTTEEDEIQSEQAAFTLAKRICSSAGANVSLEDLASEDEETLLTAAANSEPADLDKARKVVMERLSRFKVDVWREEMISLQRQAQQAQRDQDRTRTAELFDRIMELKIRMESVGAQ